MQINDGEYVEQTDEEYFQYLERRLTAVKPDAATEADTIINGLLDGFSTTLAGTFEQNLSEVYQAGYVVDADGEELTKRANELGFTRKDAVKATGVVEFSRNQEATTDYTIDSGTVVETLTDDPIQFETTEDVTLAQGTTSVTATIQALEGGTDGNVGANTIEAMPSPPTGVGEVTNPEAIGDPSQTDTDGDPLLVGQDQEGDRELRNRILRQDGSPQSASSDDIEATLLNQDSVIDVTAKVNAKSDDNTGSGGLPPYSTEVVVQGGTDSEIVETLFDTMSHIDFRRLHAGVYGTEVTYTVYDSFIEQDVTGRFSRPSVIDPQLDVDIVVTDNYSGNEAVKDELIKYTGGTEFVGLTLGEDVYIEQLRNSITDVDGVRGISDLVVDTNDDGTDDRTTDSDGLDILGVAQTEVVYVQPDDITVTTT